jgi:hypothetical protein
MIRRNGKRCCYYAGKIIDVKLHGNYKHLCLSIDGRRKGASIHKLVALAFIPNPLNKSQINHKDGVKSNNHVLNLEWASPKENIRHAFDVLKHKGPNLGKVGILSHCNKQISQYNKNRKYVATYYSLKYAAEITKIDGTNICNALKNPTKSAGGFIWKYGDGQQLASYADRTFEVTKNRKGISKVTILENATERSDL